MKFHKEHVEGMTFILGLVITLIVLHLLHKYITTHKINHDMSSHKKKLNFGLYPYSYMGCFAIIIGMILFFGYSKLKPIFSLLFKHPDLISLFTTTFVATFGFIYVAYLHDIIEKYFNVVLSTDPWDNIIGYVGGRLIVISIIYFFIL